MNYTITAARFADAVGASAIIETLEAGAVVADKSNTPALWADMLAWGEPEAYAPSPVPVPEEISDRQFAQALAKLDPPLISRDEALAFVKRGEVPERLQAAIDAIPDPDVRFDVDMQVSGATIFRWSHPTTASLAAALQQSPEQMAALWRFAASLD